MFDDKEQEKEITTVLFRLFLFLFFFWFGSSSLLINIKNILTISQLIYIFFFD